MVLRIFLFALMSLGLGGFGIIAWVSTRPPATAVEPRPAEVAEQEAKPEPPKPAAKVFALVAARPLRAGALLKPEEITAREFPADALPEGHSLDTLPNRHALVGAMVRRPAALGELLLAGDVMRPGERGFLATVLAPGMRAVTIGVDAISGAAGLIWPGDRVDVILTQQVEDPSVPVGRRVSAETVQRNARVIAIDQQLVQGAVAGGAEGNAARTVTIEVTGQQALQVQVAARIGRLSLSVLASDISESGSDAQSAVFAADVSAALARQPPQIRTDVIRVHSGTSDSKEYKVR
jgi:pilus assembly protein CpaB